MNQLQLLKLKNSRLPITVPLKRKHQKLNTSNEKPKKKSTKIQTARKRPSNVSTPSTKGKSTKKISPLVTKSALTPKPRLISLGSQKYESDDESDEEDVSEIRKPVTATKDVDSAGTSTKPFALPFSIRRFCYRCSYGCLYVAVVFWVMVL